jgi:hypothetical protein
LTSWRIKKGNFKKGGSSACGVCERFRHDVICDLVTLGWLTIEGSVVTTSFSFQNLFRFGQVNLFQALALTDPKSNDPLTLKIDIFSTTYPHNLEAYLKVSISGVEFMRFVARNKWLYSKLLWKINISHKIWYDVVCYYIRKESIKTHNCVKIEAFRCRSVVSLILKQVCTASVDRNRLRRCVRRLAFVAGDVPQRSDPLDDVLAEPECWCCSW